MNEFGLPSAIFVYNDAVGHMTQFWPLDWLLLHTSSIPWHRGDTQFTRFPAMQLYGGGSLVSTLSSFYPVTRVWYLLSIMSVDQ